MGQTFTAALDLDTVAQLYDRHAATAYGLAQQLTGRADVAGALTEAVFVELVSTATVADFQRRLLIEIHRRAVAWVRQSGTPAAHPDMAAGEECQLADLPERERAAITNAYFGGSTYNEIAAGMHVGAGQVANLMRRGLQRLAGAQPCADSLPQPSVIALPNPAPALRAQ